MKNRWPVFFIFCLPFLVVHSLGQVESPVDCSELVAKAKTQLVLYSKAPVAGYFGWIRGEEVGSVPLGEHFEIMVHFVEKFCCGKTPNLWLLVQSRDDRDIKGWILIEDLFGFSFWEPGLWDWVCLP